MDAPNPDVQEATRTAGPAQGQRLGSLLGRNLRALAASQVVGKIVGFGAMVVLARYLGRVDFGRYTVAVALVSLLAVITEFGTNRYIVREGAQRPEMLGEVVGHVLLIRGSLAAGTVGLAVAIGASLGYDHTTLLAVVLFSGAQALRLLGGAYLLALQAIERVGDLAAVQAQQSVVLAVVLSISAVTSESLIVVSWAVLGVSALFPPWAWLRLRRRWSGTIRLRGEGFFSTLRTTTAFAVSSAMFALLTYLDSVMVQAFKGNAETGLYGAAYRLLLSLSLVPIVYNEAVARSISHLAVRARDHMDALYSRTLSHLVILALPVVAGGAVLSHRLLTFVFGGAYGQADTALAILLGSLVFVFPGYVNVTTAYALGLERSLARILPVVVGANAVANLGLIPWLGMEGAAIATLGAEVLFIALLTGRLARAGVKPRGGAPIVKAAAAAAIMAGAVWPLRSMALAVPIAVGAAVYIGVLLALRTFEREDRELLRGMFGRPEAARGSFETGGNGPAV